MKAPKNRANLSGILICLSMAIALLMPGCENAYSSFSDDSGLDGQGRITRGTQFLREEDFDRALAEAEGALSLDSGLSEAYYLKAQVGTRRYGVDISVVDTALSAEADTATTDSTPVFFAGRSTGRKDSILKGNLIVFENLEIIRSDSTLDSVITFSDIYMDYTVTCGVLGMITLFDFNADSTIDSTDSVSLAGIQYRFGGNVGFSIQDTDTSDSITPDSLDPVLLTASSYFQQGISYVDSLLIPYGTDTSDYGFEFRSDLKATLTEYYNDITALTSPKRRR